MTYLFNKLGQVYVGTNKLFDKCTYAFGSFGCCHFPQKIATKVIWYLKKCLI